MNEDGKDDAYIKSRFIPVQNTDKNNCARKKVRRRSISVCSPGVLVSPSADIKQQSASSTQDEKCCSKKESDILILLPAHSAVSDRHVYNSSICMNIIIVHTYNK